MTMTMAVSNYTSSCHQLATNLSASYYSPARFNNSYNGGTLEDYLSTTGALLTMCERWEPHCILPMLDPRGDGSSATTTFSGSWIQNSTTGVRVFGDNGVGVILNPHVFSDKIQCLYPLNADSLARGRGRERRVKRVGADRQDVVMGRCGPLMDDPIYGTSIPLSWYGRFVMKLKLHWIKWTKFPLRTPWKDIPCSEILHELRDMDNIADDNNDDDDDFIDRFERIPMMIDHDQTWKGIGYFFKETVDIILGEEGCYDDFEPNFEDGHLLAYLGPDPWDVNSWDDNTAITKAVIQQYPNFDRGIWNEIVIQNPLLHGDDDDDHNHKKKLISEMILAVFYLNEPNREEAYILAKGIGHDMPVLELLKDQQQVFRCPSAQPQPPDEKILFTENIE